MEHRLERVERYLDGLLSAEQIVDFEADLSNDKNLRRDMHFVQLERKIVASTTNVDKEMQLRLWNRAYQKKRSLRQLGLWSVVILLSALLTWWLIKKKTETGSNNLIIALYEKPKDINYIERSGPTNEDNKKEVIINTTKKYLEAHQLFQDRKYQEAEQVFRSLIPDVNFGLDAEWFAVLAYYMQEDRPTQITPSLDSILVDERHPYHSAAQDLVSLLKQ